MRVAGPGRQRTVGPLGQGRFTSFVLDDDNLFAATRYVEWNPVRAGLDARPQDYSWSSASAHLAGEDDELAKVSPLLTMIEDRPGFLGLPAPEDLQSRLQHHERTGRPLGNQGFLTRLEATLNRILTPQKPGREPKQTSK